MVLEKTPSKLGQCPEDIYLEGKPVDFHLTESHDSFPSPVPPFTKDEPKTPEQKLLHIIEPIKNTPATYVGYRDKMMKTRMLGHRFYQAYKGPHCAVTRNSCDYMGLIEAAHLIPISMRPPDIKKWEWGLGYPYKRTFNVNTRLNAMFLTPEIHKRLDNGAYAILIPGETLELIRQLFYKNEKLPIEKRECIPLVLDKLMPKGGWEYVGILSKKNEYRDDCFLLHKTVARDGKVEGKTEIAEFPCRISFKSAASPVFVLANFGLHDEPPELPDFWDSELRQWAQDMHILCLQIQRSPISPDFLPKPRNPTREQKAKYAVETGLYDYQNGCYQMGTCDSKPDNDEQDDSGSITPLLEEEEERFWKP